MVMEKASGKELMDRIVKHSHFSERVAASYFRMMVSGIKHCHDNHVRAHWRGGSRDSAPAAGRLTLALRGVLGVCVSGVCGCSCVCLCVCAYPKSIGVPP
jgi:serine/threonine protein kinase